MEYLQVTNTESNHKLNSRLLALLLNINVLAVLINFTLNFFGSPTLKYHYLIHIIITLVAIILFKFDQIFPILLSLFFLEGQGRILWDNANWTKIIFDSLIFLSILKIFISNKKIFTLKGIPKPILILITFHFLWYLLEFSNLNSISYFAVAASSKIYIYPILFFLALTQIDFNIYQPQFQKNLNFFIFLLFLELALTFYQYSMKESFVLQITQNYHVALKDSVFSGSFYRPFATSFAPGAISAYFFLTIGFLFFKKKSPKEKVIKIILIGATTFAIIICQVRSAVIKIAIIVSLIQLGELIYYRFKMKSFINVMFFSIIIILGTQFILEKNLDDGDDGLKNAKDRLTSIGNTELVKNARLTLPMFFKIASEKIMSNPLGLGPGLTGAVGRLTIDQVRESRFLNVNMLWSSDNLIITLLIDFGIGAIFYILLLLYIPTYFIQFLTVFYFNKNFENFKILLVCFSSISAILVGSWGAVGIVYNPESFVFWFFAALGFSTIAKYKRDNLNTLSNV